MELKTYRLDDVTVNFDKKRIPLSGAQREKRQGEYRYYGAQGVIDYIDDYIFDGTYLLIAEDGENLKSQKQNIAQIATGRFWVNNHAHIVQGNVMCDTRFLCYLLNSMDLSGYVTGSAQPKLSQANLNAVTISIPEIGVQKKIADYLYTIDRKIDTNIQLNDNLEQQAQTLFAELFCLQNGDPVPKGWVLTALGDVAVISNKSFNPLKKPETMLEHYSIPAFDETRYPVFELSTDIKSNKFIIDADCFMISKLNPTTKRVWRPYCMTGNAVCSTEFIVYKAKDRALTDFLYSLIDSVSFSDFMCSHVTGSTGSRQRTIPSDTLQYQFYLPTAEEIAAFSAVVAPMYAQIRVNAMENARLKALRDSLLPRLMSGEIDVSDLQL